MPVPMMPKRPRFSPFTMRLYVPLGMICVFLAVDVVFFLRHWGESWTVAGAAQFVQLLLDFLLPSFLSWDEAVAGDGPLGGSMRPAAFGWSALVHVTSRGWSRLTVHGR